jgi:hypothetical protein
MVYKLFNGDTIIAPLKCGTRYLERVFGVPTSEIASYNLKSNLFIPNLKTIIIRPPIEHLISALHTEILGFLRKNEGGDIKEILNTFVSFDPKNWQNAHWDKNVYPDLYWYWRRNRNYVNVIELKNLSSHLKELKIKKLPKYDSNDYDFNNYKYWCSKDDLMLFIKANYKKEWDNLIEQVGVSTIFYDYLINKEVIDIKLI